MFALSAIAAESPAGGSHAVSATATPPSALAPLQPGLDYHSFANIEQFRATRIELDLRVDFRNKVLLGAAGLEVKRLDPGATELVLDTRDLDVRDVSEKAVNLMGATAKSQTTWVSRPFHFEKADPVLGSPLVIELAPATRKSSEVIKIEYVTSPTSAALAWLGSGESGAKHDPLFFTLPGPIGARSWIPLQDTPQVRVTVGARIHTDKGALAVMSAKNDPHAKRSGDYTFEMIYPVPSFALALVVGDLHFRDVSPRSGIYGEKALIGRPGDGLSELERLVAAGEAIAGPYPCERADVLVLPPLFPYTERAHPRLDYLGSSALGAEERAVAAAAQTLARAWAGYWVAPATWRDAWIDEGLSGYLAHRMSSAVLGEARATLAEAVALRSLPEELAALKPEDQHLAVDLRGQDPGRVAQRARAAKARLLFEWLEVRFGRERLDAFLRAYFEHFAQKSITTEQFVDYLDQELIARPPRLITRAAVLSWIQSPGLPGDAPRPSLEALAPVDGVRAAWLAGRSPAAKLETRGWTSVQWQYFLEGMPGSLRREQLAELEKAFDFARRPDADVARDWFALVIRGLYSPAFPQLEDFLKTQGRLMLVVPLYEALMKTPAGAAAARRVYAQASPHYLAPTIAALEPIVAPSEAGDDE
ncbi:MAG TPA: leukotriene A4 hydrolase C-terminal domain-containing protein [Steroidobacteraceae bacterium]|nr:leukotriene A4 hydrolase C-terminal domain-containing protein [Steroidobacteraceae bacterium]